MRNNRTLAVDIGNTNITAGLFEGPRLARKTKMPTARPDRYLARLSACIGSDVPDVIVISSVVPDALRLLLGVVPKLGAGRVLVAGRNVRVPVRNRYRRKREVGQDRLVNAYASGVLYGTPAVVVDFGTAVTFDVISKRGDYLGGLIMPGIGISLASLYDKTALLPRVALRDAQEIIARDTVNSIRGGILFGFGAMCDGLIARYRKILGPGLAVIATGGNASLVRKYATSIMIVDEDLTLKGLWMLGVR